MPALRWTERAVENLAGIADYISQHSAVYAEGVVARIDQQLELLRRHPLMGKPAREAEDLNVRELVIDAYRVFYRAEGDVIVLLAIVHGRQNSQTRFLPRYAGRGGSRYRPRSFASSSSSIRTRSCSTVALAVSSATLPSSSLCTWSVPSRCADPASAIAARRAATVFHTA